jgi:4-diphosphocytidyl-2-C-methyl-D-erythritol kinase
MQPLSLLAPAKINVALHVLGRLANGYHELDSIFLPLDLADEIELRVEVCDHAEVLCHCPGQEALEGPENLAARAATDFLRWRKVHARVELTLIKKIWIAAGLGGGSSDAAAVLRGLATVWPVDPLSLLRLAQRLGADVPYFLRPHPARVQGLGERITPLPHVPAFALVLANPGQPLSTASVYQRLGLAPGQETGTPPLSLVAPLATIEELLPLLKNDLSRPAIELLPEVQEMLTALRLAGASGVGMSGSGPSVFGVFPSRLEAYNASQVLAQTSTFHTLITETLASS